MTEIQNLQAMGAQRMTSLEIAEITGKQHKNLMRDIRNMEAAWEKTTGLKFALSEYQDSTGRALPCYSLTKTECLYIATKFNDEARARLFIYYSKDGKHKERTYLVWTLKGAEMIDILLKNKKGN